MSEEKNKRAPEEMEDDAVQPQGEEEREENPSEGYMTDDVDSALADDDDKDGKKDSSVPEKNDKKKDDDDEEEKKDDDEEDKDKKDDDETDKKDDDLEKPNSSDNADAEPESRPEDAENEAGRKDGETASDDDMSLQDPDKKGGDELGETGTDKPGGEGAGGEVPPTESPTVTNPSPTPGLETAEAAGEVAAEGGATAAEAGGGAAAAEGGAAAAAAEGAGGAAAAGGISVLGIVLIVILIILILIGIFGFLTAVPSMTVEKAKEFVQGIWDGIQGYFIGADKARVNDEELVEVAQYLYDMGYDLEGCGFVNKVEFEKDANGNSTGIIKKVESSYLTAYLVAENRTYMISNENFNWADVFESLVNGRITDGITSAWGTGLIHIEKGLWSEAAWGIMNGIPILDLTVGNIADLVENVSIDRETNTLKISRADMSSGLAFWNWHRDTTYYNLAGWSGRYGKPFELLVTLHLATMAPDFAYEIAMNEDLNARVNICLKNAKFEGNVYIKTEDGLTYGIEDLEDAGYSEDVIEKMEELEKEAKNIKTKTPYIKDVEHHWFRNVYFDTDGETVEYAVIDEPEDEEEDSSTEKEDVQYVYEEVNGERKLKTTTGAINVYEIAGTSNEEFAYTGEVEGLNPGDKVIFKGTIADKITQKEDGVRGVTNPTTKELFRGEYYIYDGTIERANKIKNGEVEKQKLDFNKESLTAFSILENETSIDSQLIYRDLKELLVELDYYDYEDFEKDTARVLEWPIPEYSHSTWPERKIEKQVLDYGTLIASKSAVKVFREEETRQEANGEEIDDEDTNNTSNPQSLDGFIMIGDSWTVGLESLTSVREAGMKTFAKSGAAASYWLENYSRISGQNANGVIVYLGLNNTQGSGDMKTLLWKLKESYPNVPIYVLKVPHVAKTVNNGMNPATWNSQIDQRNSTIQSYCNSNGLNFIDTTEGLIGSDGYLSDTYASGGGFHLTGAGYELFFQNIKKQVANGGVSSQLVGFEEGLDVVAMDDCTVLEKVLTMHGAGVKFELTGDIMLKGYTLIMAGFEEEVSVGDELEKEDVIGTTTGDSLVIILIDKEKANVENVEDYIKIPKKNGLGNIVLGNDYDVSDEAYFVTDLETFKKMFEGRTVILENAQAFLEMQEKYGVNAVFAACVTIAESSGGTNWAAIDPSTHNWFSIKGSYRGNSKNGWRSYPSFAAAVEDFGDLIANGSYYYKSGRYTVSQIGPTYCNEQWSVTVASLMTTAYEKVLNN